MSRVLVIVFATAVLGLGGLSAVQAAPPSGADPILRWNLLALDAVAEDHTGTYGAPSQGGPTRTARALAIVHLAMYDAANSCKKKATPYRVYVPLMGQLAAVDAAVSQAGHDTLVAMYPDQAAIFDAALAEDLDAVSNLVQRYTGVMIGKLVAKAILDSRASDGSANNPPYVPGTLPGQHRADPLHPDQGYLTPAWGACKPFALLSGSQYRSPPPPALTSPYYAWAYDQVKRLGGDGVNTPTERTEEQTIIGTYWGYDGAKKIGTPPRLYNQVVRTIAIQKKNDVYANARLFGLVNLAMTDAGIACWETKYHYNVWRPVLGIRESDPGTGPSGLGDGNDATIGDVTWTPQGAMASNGGGTDFTPPFPAYPSGHATFGSALCQTLRNFYGTDHIEFDFVSDEYNGVTTDDEGNVRPLINRHFTNLTQVENENAISRVYLGVHWFFDATSGVVMGRQVANFAGKHYLKPLK